MQDATTRIELHSLHSSGDVPPITSEPTGPPGNEPTGHDEPTGALKDEPQVAGTPSPLQPGGPRAKPRTLLPQRGLYYAAIAGVIAGVVTALAGLVLLTVILSLLIGFVVGVIVGGIAVRRRLGFLAGALAGAVFSLLTFLVGLIPSYPGNLAVNGTTMTAGSLVLSLLLLCLWSTGGGLVSLFGTWVVTVRHPHYLRLGEQ